MQTCDGTKFDSCDANAVLVGLPDFVKKLKAVEDRMTSAGEYYLLRCIEQCNICPSHPELSNKMFKSAASNVEWPASFLEHYYPVHATRPTREMMFFVLTR